MTQITQHLSLFHSTIVAFVVTNAPLIANAVLSYVGLTLLSFAFGKRTQVEAFVARHPTLTFWLRAIRGAGFDPCILAKATREYLQHELTLQGPVLLRALKTALKLAFRVGPVALALVTTGCLSQLHSDVERALVFEQQVQSEAIQLKSLADNAIQLLPADKQEAARKQYTAASEKLAVSLAAKDALLQSALDSTESQVSLGKLALDIVDAVDAIMDLLRAFGVTESQLQSVALRANGLRVTAVRL